MSEIAAPPVIDGAAKGLAVRNYIIVALLGLVLGGGGVNALGLVNPAQAVAPIDAAQVKPICREVVTEELATFRSELTLMRSELGEIKSSVDSLASTTKTIVDFYLSKGLGGSKR